jgi:hypothetical protein
MMEISEINVSLKTSMILYFKTTLPKYYNIEKILFFVRIILKGIHTSIFSIYFKITINVIIIYNFQNF